MIIFKNFRHIYGLTLLLVVVAACTTTPEIKMVHGDNQTPSTVTDTKKPPAVVKSTTTFDPAIFKNDKPLSSMEIRKYGYELGLDPLNILTDAEHLAIQKRRKVRNLERTLDSQKERLNYSKVIPWLETDDEKIAYLSIPSIEGRQAWVNKNRIWLRNTNFKDFEDAVKTQDIILGMPADFVKKAWGEPDAIENSGNPIYKNERWKYIKQVSTPNGYHQERRYVYLEGGRVVGWETE